MPVSLFRRFKANCDGDWAQIKIFNFKEIFMEKFFSFYS